MGMKTAVVTAAVAELLTAAVALAAGVPARDAGPSSPVVAASPQPDGSDVARAAQTLVRDGARSATVAVWEDGRLTSAAVPSTPSSATRPFRIGSATKVFTATVVLQLVGAGRIALDDPVERYLPDLPPAYHAVTVRQMLQHRSGMPDYADRAYAGWLRQAQQSDSVGPRQVLAFALSHPPLFVPGSQWHYSNTNYIALGLIVEAVTHHPFGAELAGAITGPLRLFATRMPTTRTVAGLVDDPGINPGVPWTAGAIVSTARDLAEFLAALLSGRVLRAAELAEMRQTVPTPEGFAYGLGLMSMLFPCGTFWGHTGGTLDYLTRAWSSADARRVVVLNWRGGALTGTQPLPPLECPPN
jgi:D-alanyl-D-alanine carboxypeptidase